MIQKENKVMTMTEAVSKYVNDGDTLYLPWGNPGGPSAAIHEIMRQNKKDLTVIAMALFRMGGSIVLWKPY